MVLYLKLNYGALNTFAFRAVGVLVAVKALLKPAHHVQYFFDRVS